MKKLLTLTAVCAVLTAPAIGVHKCVYTPTMDNWDVCTGGNDGIGDGKAGWHVECNGIQYRGIATFSTSDVGDVAESIDSATAKPSEVYCYCKMIYPVLSKWIKVGSGFPTKTISGDIYNTYIISSMNDDCSSWCVNYGYDGEGYAETVRKFLSNLEEN